MFAFTDGRSIHKSVKSARISVLIARNDFLMSVKALVAVLLLPTNHRS